VQQRPVVLDPRGHSVAVEGEGDVFGHKFPRC
jgi:hypothetical protein